MVSQDWDGRRSGEVIFLLKFFVKYKGGKESRIYLKGGKPYEDIGERTEVYGYQTTLSNHEWHSFEGNTFQRT